MPEERRQAPDLPPTRCEWCGADYDPNARPVATGHPALTREVEIAEPPTHCEFCGAEYPVPREDEDA
jgi:hypothetical protein